MNTRVFEIRNMNNGIHELWVLNKYVRVATIQKLLNMLNKVECEADYDFVYSIINTKISDSFEVNFRDKDENGNYYNKYKVANSRIPDVY